MKIMILGSKGSLGSELRRVFPEAIAMDRSDLDIGHHSRVEEILAELKPDVVLNAAAYTDVDAAEHNGAVAYNTNYHGVMRLVNSCDKSGTRLVHFSTDYVFDGENPNGYLESDMRNPSNVYGNSKAKGEEIVERSHGEHLIIRTSWLYGNKKSFPEKIVSKARSTGLLKVIHDQIGSPTYAADLADRIPKMLDAPKGTYHLTNTGVPCSWFDFAEDIVNLAGIECRVVPRSTEEHNKEFPSTAKRPKCSILLNSKYEITGPPMRDWRSALLDYMQKENLVKT